MDSVPDSSTNLLVRFLDHSVDDDAFRAFFSQFGHILASIVQRDIHNGQSRGFGFVRFSTHSEACVALKKGNDTLLGRKRINVLWAKKQHDDIPVGDERLKMNKLFVRNVPTKITDATLARVFSEFGAVADVSIHQDTTVSPRSAPTSAQRHIAFITFEEIGAAERALKKIHNTSPFRCCNGIPLMCKLSENYQEKDHHKPAAKAATVAPVVPHLQPSDLVAEENGNSNDANLNSTSFAVPSYYADNTCGRPSLNYVPTPSDAYSAKAGISPFRGYHERTYSTASNVSVNEHSDAAEASIQWWPSTPRVANAHVYQTTKLPSFNATTSHAVSPAQAPTHLHYSSSAHPARHPGKMFAPPPSPRLESLCLPTEDLYMPGYSTPLPSGRYVHNPYAMPCLDE